MLLYVSLPCDLDNISRNPGLLEPLIFLCLRKQRFVSNILNGKHCMDFVQQLSFTLRVMVMVTQHFVCFHCYLSNGHGSGHQIH